MKLSRTLGLLVVLLPSMAAAQEGVVIPSAPVQDRQAPAAARPADAGGKRRPSMVGYVNDSDIRTGIRVRFDSAWEVQAPDRAEFFYAKCGCYRSLPATNAAFDPDAAGPGPGVVTDLKFNQLLVLGEYAVSPRASVFATLPIRFLRPEEFVPGTGSFGNQSGLSDIQFGAKAALLSDARRQVTVSLNLAAPSGDSLKGLGTNHWSVEPALLYHERATDRVSVEAQFGEVFPTDGSPGVPRTSPQKFSGKVLYYGFGPSVEVYRQGDVAFAPVVEIVGWHVLGGYQTLDHNTAQGTDIVNLKFGGRILMRNDSSIYVGYGKALSDDLWYDHILRLEYRVGFGRR
jgi:Putative MetA-pathway of phenol degradation